MKKLLFIYNPHAGKGKIQKRLSGVVDVFALKGFLPTVCPTRGAGDATRLAKALGSKFSRVVCSGGDGTLHEVVTGLMELEQPPVVGYIPAGSTNDFSRNLHLPGDMVVAAHTAVSEETAVCDIGRFNGAPFVYVAAFGAFTDVSYDTPQQFKNLFGHLAYLLNGVTRLGAIRAQHMTVEYDGGTLEGDFIFGMMSNTRSVGGFKGIPVSDVQLDDGLFEVVLVHKPKNAMELQSILTSVVKGSPVEGGPLVGFHTSRLKVTAQGPVAWTLDGEYGGDHQTAEIEVCQKALEFCCRDE